MTYSSHRTIFAATVAALAVACATPGEQPKQQPPPQSAALPSYQDTRTESATAVVQAIDQASRRVTLKAEDGTTFTFVAGPQVRNLAQVGVGDAVKVTYTESLALEVRRGDGTPPEAAVATAGQRAEPGEKPAGALAQVVTVSAEIIAIDRTANRVTLKGPEGNFRVLQVRDPKKLESVKVGDMVYATYTESLGIAVEKVQSAK